MSEATNQRRNDVEKEEKTSLHSLSRPMKPSINMCMHKKRSEKYDEREHEKAWLMIAVYNQKQKKNQFGGYGLPSQCKNAQGYINILHRLHKLHMLRYMYHGKFNVHYILHECMRRAFKWLAFVVCIAQLIQ